MGILGFCLNRDLCHARQRASFLVLFVVCTSPAFLRAQQKAADSPAPPEIIATDDGLLALTTPKGWIRADGAGAAYFVPEASGQNPRVCIYIASAPISSKAGAKDLQTYIESDISNFNSKYKNAIVRREQPLELPQMQLRASVITFRSGEKTNSFEQVIYIPDVGRVWTLVLSAKEEPLFTSSLAVFHEFAQSYRGTISVSPD